MFHLNDCVNTSDFATDIAAMVLFRQRNITVPTTEPSLLTVLLPQGTRSAPGLLPQALIALFQVTALVKSGRLMSFHMPSYAMIKLTLVIGCAQDINSRSSAIDVTVSNYEVWQHKSPAMPWWICLRGVT